MSTDIQALNDCYGVKDRITVVPHGRTHWPKVRLSTALGATAEILLYGGQLTSWKSETGKENIFLRSVLWLSSFHVPLLEFSNA
jgi:D-hexose-6-phosphate mutarotase